MYTVKKIGTVWHVIGPDRISHASTNTNAAAWRVADRLNNEPTSKAEDTADWIARKEANTE